MAADVLPTPPSMMAFVGGPAAPAAAAAAAAAAPGGCARRSRCMDVSIPNAAPVEAPKEIKPETGIERRRQGVAGGVEGGVAGGVVGGVVGGLPTAAAAAAAAPHRAPVRVGGNIKPPTKIKDVKPVYPPIAQSARVQGVVIIEATIGPERAGARKRRCCARSRCSTQAALDAVKQWQFTPTLLNGVPVPVIMTVTVNFTLQ